MLCESTRRPRVWKQQEDSFRFVVRSSRSLQIVASLQIYGLRFQRHSPHEDGRLLYESQNNTQNRSPPREGEARVDSDFLTRVAKHRRVILRKGPSQIGGELFHDSSDDVRARIRRETMEGWICQSVLCSHYTNPSDRFPAPFSLLSSSSSLGERDSRA